MEIVESQEAFRFVEGKLRFSYMQYIVRDNNILYLGKWANRHQAPRALSQLYDVEKLRTDDRGPQLKPSWKVTLGQSCYIKRQKLFDYAGKLDLERRILREVETCEIIRKHPHPNIAFYYGAQETRGRVSGLCFKRYVSTLLDKVNPQHLNKSTFLLSGRPLVEHRMKAQLSRILDGIRHLHSLGLVHNDITPDNIMLEEDGTLTSTVAGMLGKCFETPTLKGRMAGTTLL
ncbi:hypothetical protein MYCTH_2309967 [Thermothelomyces thermophilus ATCC 42464]|uniref:EKC/KEOPS complex subunit BUD32 n=1 Tax=Thermothelomyces thermophilus (strain ATCC 42464 / BCRC 31852 / DSM 1799) TaxID=573729 RepID=G2QKX3_THET4|nr:uncharacterized protein MYCTH_2309967 [Thermothelomyces thermophilus ATCC 42464]AEO60605.1 hypothetical protein MYCTH_2309967 [Thermothelomyces thermophilus ATCC 42464]